ncbi:MAG TPA: DHHA1 domain-containing protein, partial [Burkholderiales bacterium]|nr:DHHA1 domain-containing protein [Burkholderiales bacterium]
GLALYQPDWHQGVIGILAARLRERFHRPVIAFADGTQGELKGSGRSIAGLHLRDALDLLDKRHPGLLLRFGGHAGAAGLSIRSEHFERFQSAFDTLLRELLTPADLAQRIETDGALSPQSATLELAEAIARIAWGQGFPSPRFHGRFRVAEQRVVGNAHLRLEVHAEEATTSSRKLPAIVFRHAEPLPERIRAVYGLDVNEWKDSRALQLVVEYWEPCP